MNGEQMHYTTGSPTDSQCHCAPSTQGHSTELEPVMCSVVNISVLSSCPVTKEAIAPLPSLPSHNIKTVSLCACILGNLPPTMKRALASAWEENSATERKSKSDVDRGRWKSIREDGRIRRVKERAKVVSTRRCTWVNKSEGLN